MKKLIFLLLPALMPLNAAALELLLEDNRGESGTIGYVDIDRVFKEYSGTAGAREEFIAEIKKKEEALNAKKTPVFTLKAEIAKLRQEREFALTLPSLLETQRSVAEAAAASEAAGAARAAQASAAVEAAVAAQAAKAVPVSTGAVQVPAESVQLSTAAPQASMAAPQTPPPAETLPPAAASKPAAVSAPAAALPPAPTSQPAAISQPLTAPAPAAALPPAPASQSAAAPPPAEAPQPVPASPPAAAPSSAAAPKPAAASAPAAASQPSVVLPPGMASLPGMAGLSQGAASPGIDMPGITGVPVTHFKFSVSTSVPEIDAVLAKKEAELADKEEALRFFQRQTERELLEYESRKSEILLGRIYVALKELAIKEAVSVIIDKRNILFGQKAVDLTGKLMKKLEENEI